MGDTDPSSRGLPADPCKSQILYLRFSFSQGVTSGLKLRNSSGSWLFVCRISNLAASILSSFSLAFYESWKTPQSLMGLNREFQRRTGGHPTNQSHISQVMFRKT